MFVYILYSRSLKRHYVGQTQDVKSRLARHNHGKVRSTKSGSPWEVIWTKETENRSVAMLLEKKIKGRGIKRFLEDQDRDVASRF